MKTLIQLCSGYYFFYVITGVAVKWFTSSKAQGFAGMNDVEYLVYSTILSSLFCVGIVLVSGWLKRVEWARHRRELAVIFVSGVCTAFIIPATTLLFAMPISVMVAMVIMRAGVLIVSRCVDAILIYQGLLKKKVVWEENAAVVMALAALSLRPVLALTVHSGAVSKHFEFLSSSIAVGILSVYLLSYFIRLYIMNYFKNQAGRTSSIDNRAFFAAEQIFASATMLVAGCIAFWSADKAEPGSFLWKYVHSFTTPHPEWKSAAFSGTAYGMVAFFSVFIFMLRGRTATFAGLANRLTSLIAGTTATLLSWLFFAGELPARADWVSLAMIFGAVGLLYRSELKSKAP